MNVDKKLAGVTGRGPQFKSCTRSQEDEKINWLSDHYAI